MQKRIFISLSQYVKEKGDFAIVFPNVIHHYQVFGSGKNKAIYLFLEPSFTLGFYEDLQKYSPKYPIISSEMVHVDIVNSIKALVNLENFKQKIKNLSKYF